MVVERPYRPWPVPERPWALAMQWHDLLFMHWPVPVDALRAWIPEPLIVDTYDGWGWLGIVPFTMSGLHPRFIPPIPGLSAFPELNVRTYVTYEGKPGVWFFSLDAANPLAVRGARLLFQLPYYDAHMPVISQADMVVYGSVRTHPRMAPVRFSARYRPTGPALSPSEGSIDRWLTDRYCLYVASRSGSVWRGAIDHVRWELQPAEVEVLENTLTAPLRLSLPDQRPLLHFSRHRRVKAWTLDKVR